LHFRHQSGALEAQAGRRELGSADHRVEIAESGLAIIHSSPILLKSVTIARKLADELSISFDMTGAVLRRYALDVLFGIPDRNY
jgi:hypothetical protein